MTKAGTPQYGIVCRTQQHRARSSGANRLDDARISMENHQRQWTAGNATAKPCSSGDGTDLQMKLSNESQESVEAAASSLK